MHRWHACMSAWDALSHMWLWVDIHLENMNLVADWGTKHLTGSIYNCISQNYLFVFCGQSPTTVCTAPTHVQPCPLPFPLEGNLVERGLISPAPFAYTLAHTTFEQLPSNFMRQSFSARRLCGGNNSWVMIKPGVGGLAPPSLCAFTCGLTAFPCWLTKFEYNTMFIYMFRAPVPQ